MIKNTAGQKIGAQLVSASDGSAFTSAVTVAVTVDAGTQATGSVGAGACTHEGNGFHTYAPAQAETNGDHLAFTFTGTGAVPATVQVYTVAGDAFTRLGAPAGASVSADVAAIKAETASILTDTAEIGAAGAGLTALATAANLSTVSTNVDAILVDTGTTLQAELDGIQADTEDIQTRLPAALVSGRMSADAVAISGSTTAADRLELHATGVLSVVIGTGSTTTSVVLNATAGINAGAPSSTNDFYNGRVLVFITGTLAGQATDITDYVGATVTATVTALTGAPQAGDTAVLV